MGAADYYKHGDWNVICDRCGFKRKASQCRYDGYDRNLFVCADRCYDPPHPLDRPYITPDNPHVPIVRPDPTVEYLPD
jgi:hypothetical protein